MNRFYVDVIGCNLGAIRMHFRLAFEQNKVVFLLLRSNGWVRYGEVDIIAEPQHVFCQAQLKLQLKLQLS